MAESWEDLNLSMNVLRGVYSAGFEKPSPIQKQAILPIMQGKDLLAQAQSGTGKTGAFCIGAMERCTPEFVAQALILSPTRELAMQTQAVFDQLCKQTELKTALLIGGKAIARESGGEQVIIGCPGRVLDMMGRRYFDPLTLKIVVLDEADEILSQGFQGQLRSIFAQLAPSAQTVMFTATVSPELEDISAKIMRDPLKILVKQEMMTLEGISQFYVHFDNDQEKTLALKDLYEGISVSQSIIYCNSVKRVIDLYGDMKRANFPVCCIHSEMERSARNDAYDEFKRGRYRVMISSNVTARGLDVQQVSVVVNYDIPKDVHTYLHRIGRSGRWGRKGVAINFVTKFEVEKMRSIEKYYATEIKELPAKFDEFL
jgi:translation initiation factor 4A